MVQVERMVGSFTELLEEIGLCGDNRMQADEN
jgi:hypothetical protein